MSKIKLARMQTPDTWYPSPSWPSDMASWKIPDTLAGFWRHIELWGSSRSLDQRICRQTPARIQEW
jgi:hypothetical protein